MYKVIFTEIEKDGSVFDSFNEEYEEKYDAIMRLHILYKELAIDANPKDIRTALWNEEDFAINFTNGKRITAKVVVKES